VLPAHVLVPETKIIPDGSHRHRRTAAKALRIVHETPDDRAGTWDMARRNGAASNLRYR
jgi:hypothetical protein